ncbi:MAG: amino acid ABC transporter permease [Rhodobacteraceae bacterium]|nr:amino acid ABC transporter permease [Paracoccaceae bacterium]
MAVLDELIEISYGCAVRVALTLTLVAVVAAGVWNLNWDTVLNLDFTGLWRFRVAIVKGFGMTLALTAAAVLCGILLGTLLAIAMQVRFRPLQWLVIGYVETFRNTPILVQLIWIHFALPVITGIPTTAIVSGVIAIVLQASAYFSEIVRAGIQAVPKGYWEASDALGIPVITRWTHVILPPAFRTMIPPLVNMTISFFKTTAILSVLSVGELMTVSGRISNATFKPIEILTLVALIYFVFGWLISLSARKIETAMANREAWR